MKNRKPGSSSDNAGLDAKRPKKEGKLRVPFSVGTLRSVADKSAWRNQVQMFSLKSNRQQSQITTKTSESQDHIVEEGKTQVLNSRYNVEVRGDSITNREPHIC